MNKSDLVIGILEEYWTDECDAAGLANVEDIVGGEIEYQSAEGGSYIDLGEVLTALAAAATFIKNAIDIYKTLRKKSNENPNENDLKSEMKRENLVPDEIDEETQIEVYRDVCKNLNEDNLEDN